MIVTRKQLEENYASMSDRELLSLCPEKLTREAQEVYAGELRRRNLTPQKQQEIKDSIRQDKQNLEDNLKKKRNYNIGLCIKLIVVVGGMAVSRVMAHGYFLEGAATIGFFTLVFLMFRKFLP